MIATFAIFFVFNVAGDNWHLALLFLLDCSLHSHFQQCPHSPKWPQTLRTKVGGRDKHTMHSASASFAISFGCCSAVPQAAALEVEMMAVLRSSLALASRPSAAPQAAALEVELMSVLRSLLALASRPCGSQEPHHTTSLSNKYLSYTQANPPSWPTR